MPVQLFQRKTQNYIRNNLFKLIALFGDDIEPKAGNPNRSELDFEYGNYSFLSSKLKLSDKNLKKFRDYIKTSQQMEQEVMKNVDCTSLKKFE